MSGKGLPPCLTSQLHNMLTACCMILVDEGMYFQNYYENDHRHRWFSLIGSCEWLGVRRWFSPGPPISSTRYNWLVTTNPQHGRKSDENKNPNSLIGKFPTYIILYINGESQQAVNECTTTNAPVNLLQCLYVCLPTQLTTQPWS